MKKIVTLSVLILACWQTDAQVAQVVGSGGGGMSASAISIDFTVGELAIVSWTPGSLQASEGFQAVNASSGVVTGLEKGVAFSFYPNPAQRFLTIEGDFKSQKAITITDLSGKRVDAPSERYPHRTIVDVSHLPQALYILTIEDSEGTPHHIKFIKAF